MNSKRHKMTTGSTETVERELERAELATLLEGKEFVRAPKLAHLLSYLCEKYFAGEANQIKEYSIALEVFQRRDSFDQDSDSIVRVEANRLRKRLAEYYAGEGASHQVRITVPVGQYVPKFESNLSRTPLEPRTSISQESSAVADTLALKKTTDRQRWGPRQWWLTGTVGLLLLGMGITFGLIRARKERNASPPVSGIEAAAPPVESLIGPPTGQEIRILAGSSRSLVDHAGKLWSADYGFSGGEALKTTAAHIARTQDPFFYRTNRQGQFRYDIPLPKGIYELHLHFAETVFGPESGGSGGEGSRIMTVRANGKTLLKRFDVVEDAGASLTADVKVFPEITPASDGMLHLEFAGEDGKQATLSAIEVLPGLHGHIRPVRLLARQTPYYSNDSHWWSPDNYFAGGQLASFTTPVTGTDDPELFESERWGNFSYAIPVAPGKYTVTLFFAARHDSPGALLNSENKGTEAEHIFNVFCNGKVLLQNFNLTREAHGTAAQSRRFAGLEPNSQGKLLIEFVPVEGYPTVVGIEVLPQ
ncbi:malectin domain-containing carbohydrate-binding protein [Telmatobacter sp. DSM 110680]|uniref:Malectin domain-containing carbohydrate-binding protein n=1 Tax=Telmatobacter sp. DSM 110680 TaxID=3036704 RepID=A0AAU7DKI0_9BACT